MDNKNFIKIYENVISHSFCDDLIHKFESNSHQWSDRAQLSTERNMSFKELYWFQDINTWKNETDTLTNIFIKYVSDYASEFSKFCFPEKYSLEPFKMKKYEPNGVDEFGWHVDVSGTGNNDRFLAFFLYLSNNEEGKTEFPYQNITTDCVKGSMVVFPPMWPWYHRGTKPIKEPKYFMGSYLLYVN